MARGDCEEAFRAAAAADGIVLVRAKVPWLSQRGHFGLPDEASCVVETMESIFNAVGGIEAEQAIKGLTPLPGDFLHEASGTFIEIDEHQHFTSQRLAARALYRADAPLGFDLDEYRDRCREWAPRADRYRAGKEAIGFGPGGRECQRAYSDSLRDVVTPDWGIRR
jgi:hypothetical protein